LVFYKKKLRQNLGKEQYAFKILWILTSFAAHRDFKAKQNLVGFFFYKKKIEEKLRNKKKKNFFFLSHCFSNFFFVKKKTNLSIAPSYIAYPLKGDVWAMQNNYCASYEVQFEFVKQPLYSLTLFGLFS